MNLPQYNDPSLHEGELKQKPVSQPETPASETQSESTQPAETPAEQPVEPAQAEEKPAEQPVEPVQVEEKPAEPVSVAEAAKEVVE
jgi:cell division protein FtsN